MHIKIQSNGYQHERIARTALSVALAFALAGATVLGWATPLAFLVGMWAGIYIITPDADFLTVTHAETRWFRDPRQGSAIALIGSVLRFHIGWLALSLGLWPGLLLSHRGVSHRPIVGAIVIALLTIPSVPMATLLCWLAYVGRLDLLVSPVIMAGLAGFVVAHCVHIVVDWL